MHQAPKVQNEQRRHCPYPHRTVAASHSSFREAGSCALGSALTLKGCCFLDVVGNRALGKVEEHIVLLGRYKKHWRGKETMSTSSDRTRDDVWRKWCGLDAELRKYLPYSLQQLHASLKLHCREERHLICRGQFKWMVIEKSASPFVYFLLFLISNFCPSLVT